MAKTKTHDAVAKLVCDAYNRAEQYKSSVGYYGAASACKWGKRMRRAYHKEHEPDEKRNYPNMVEYFGLIQLKVNSTYGWMRNLTVGSQDNPVVLEPTAIVELPDTLSDKGKVIFKNRVIKQLLSTTGAQPQELFNPGTGALWTPVIEYIKSIAKEEKAVQRKIAYGLATEALERHADVIYDQLLHGGWRQAYSRLMFDALLYPAGFMAFGEYRNGLTWSWSGNKIKRKKDVKPCWRHIPFTRAFVAPDASSAHDGEFFIEVMSFSREMLIMLRGEDAAILGEIDALLQENNCNTNWLNADEKDEWLHSGNHVDAIKYSGTFTGRDIKRVDSGVSTEDNAIWHVTSIVVDGRTIWFDAEPDELAERNYVSVSYADMGCGYGLSVGMMLYDRQKRLNRLQLYQQASEYMAHGPVVEYSGFINTRDTVMTPWKSFESSSEEAKGIRFHQANPMWQSLQAQFLQHLRLSDDECGIPAFAAYGTQAGSPTLGQDVIRFNAAQKGLQSFGLSMDENVIEPVFQTLYHENLVYSNDDNIKSDAVIKPRGISARVNQEAQKGALTANLQGIVSLAQAKILPPELAQAAAREYAESMGLPVDEHMPDKDGQLNLDEFKTNRPGLPSPTADGRSPGANI